ncbi:hypothetical protein J4Q44_G00046080 [Coregonus suidteri]|uniref:Uncharacterized protein n=1 Tax=Coregonus suidteri TaxID=861788 RepID=A0AAN8R4Q6_9TELE
MSSGQGILNVFSCSNPGSKAISKRKLRQTRSLDPDIIRKCGTETDGTHGHGDRLGLPGLSVEDAGAFSSSPSSPEHAVALKSDPRSRNLRVKQPLSSSSGPSTPSDLSPISNFHFDYDVTVRGAKRNTAWDLPFLVRSPSVTPTGSTNTLFSPRRWLQKKQQQSSSHAYIVWKSERAIGPALLPAGPVDFIRPSKSSRFDFLSLLENEPEGRKRFTGQVYFYCAVT